MAFVVAGRSEDTQKSLSLHRLLMRFSSAATSAFLWVFIFEYFAVRTTIGHALVSTALLYALSQTTTILLVPFALKRLRGGMRRALVYGTLLQAAAFVFLGALLGGIFPHGLTAIALLFGAYRALYRVPYAVEYAALAGASTPGLFLEIALALVPLIAGMSLVVSAVPPAQLFFAAASLALLSLVPISFVPNVYEAFSWGYQETFAHLAAPENRRLLLSSVGKGLQGCALFFAWPLVLLFIFAGSLVGLGAAFSATLLFVLLFRASNRRVLVEDHADGGTFLDEYTALKEIGMGLGRILLCITIAIAIAAST
jgi:hypothetical protein